MTKCLSRSPLSPYPSLPAGVHFSQPAPPNGRLRPVRCEVILLPSGKFPRFLLFAACFAASLLIYDIVFMREVFARLLLSNSLGASVMALASVSCFYVAFRSSGYVRQIWILLAVAVATECCGQILSSYYQSFVPGSSLSAEPSDIFFFVWAAPVFMILLPRSEEEFQGIDVLRSLDFLQIAIVAVTAYLYFFYFTSRWTTDEYSLVRGILTVYIARDLLLASAFFYRSRSAAPSWLRDFFSILALVFLLSIVSDADYLLTLAAAAGNSSWGDLFAMLPYLVIILLAAYWFDREPAASVAIPAAATRGETFFTSQFFPLVMPLLVIFMARAIAPSHALLAWVTLGASVLCSSIRLILTNRRQRRITADLLATEEALQLSQQMLSTAFYNSPDGFAIYSLPDGKYYEVNEGFTRITGHSRDAALGKSPDELGIWPDLSARHSFLAELLEKRNVRNFPFQVRTKSGQIRDALISGTVVNISGTERALIAVRDITEIKAAQDALRHSEERFRSLVHNLHVGIITCDAEGHILFANKSILAMFNSRDEEVIGKLVYDLGLLTLGEDGELLPDESRPILSAIRSGQPRFHQLLGLRRPEDHETLWTVVDIVPETDSAGRISRFLISLTNVTDQRRATAALRESEELFRTLVDNLQAAVVLHGIDGRVEYINPAALRMFKYPQDFVARGKLPADLGIVTLAEDGRTLAEEERPVVRVLRTHSPVTNVNVGLHRIETGETFWVFGSSVPRFDSRGNFLGVITSFTDLTEQRRAIEALRESEERFRTLVRDLHVGVILHNPDATVQFANQAALDMFEQTREEIYGQRAERLGWHAVDVNGRPIPYDKLPAETVLRTKLPVYNNVLGWRRPESKGTLWIYGNAVPQYAPDGSIFRVITSFSDITEMKNAERSIHQLSTELLKLQDEERRRIGRELHDGMAQTVLAVNLSLAQIRQSGQPLTDASKRALDKARELLQQMSREIRTLSYLLHPPLLDDLGLGTALKEYVNGFSERSGIDTQLELPSRYRRLPQMVETAFFRITQESLSNIQRHSGSKAAKVSLLEDSDSVILEITDYGHGMPAPKNGEALRPPRLGVGIPGMRERMAQLGGYLDIESNSRGTTVRARILLSAPALKDALHDTSAPSYRG